MTDRAITFSLPMVDALWDGRKTQTRRTLRGAPFATDLAVQGCYHRPDGRWMWTMRHRPDNGPGEGVGVMEPFRVPYAVGDRLWVREPYYQFGHWERTGSLTPTGRDKWAFMGGGNVAYEIGDERTMKLKPGAARASMDKKAPATPHWHKRLARFMPREHSRITLHVREVRVQRLQEISEGDALAEGVLARPIKSYPDMLEYHVPGVDHPNKDFPYLSRPTAREMYGALMDTLHGSGFWASNPWIVAVTFDVVKQPIGRKS